MDKTLLSYATPQGRYRDNITVQRSVLVRLATAVHTLLGKKGRHTCFYSLGLPWAKRPFRRGCRKRKDLTCSFHLSQSFLDTQTHGHTHPLSPLFPLLPFFPFPYFIKLSPPPWIPLQILLPPDAAFTRTTAPSFHSALLPFVLAHCPAEPPCHSKHWYYPQTFVTTRNTKLLNKKTSTLPLSMSSSQDWVVVGSKESLPVVRQDDDFHMRQNRHADAALAEQDLDLYLRTGVKLDQNQALGVTKAPVGATHSDSTFKGNRTDTSGHGTAVPHPHWTGPRQADPFGPAPLIPSIPVADPNQTLHPRLTETGLARVQRDLDALTPKDLRGWLADAGADFNGNKTKALDSHTPATRFTGGPGSRFSPDASEAGFELVGMPSTGASIGQDIRAAGTLFDGDPVGNFMCASPLLSIDPE